MIVWLIIGAVIAPVLLITQADPDLWGHVRFGLDMLAGSGLPSVDPYAFTQDVPWINHEWLSELQMAIAYRLAGPAGLSILKGALAILILVLVIAPYRKAPLWAAGGVLVLVGAGTGRILVTLRPQLWSLIAFAILCRFLVGMPRRFWLASLPLLFACWANVHGGWVVGAGALAIWTSGQLVRPQVSRALACAIAVLSALATLATPYGWRLWEFLAATVRPSRNISEWQPLSTAPFINWIAWAVVAAGAIAIAARVRPRPERILLVALLAWGSFRVVRLLPFFVIAGVVLMGASIPVPREDHARRTVSLPMKDKAVLALITIGLLLTSTVIAARRVGCISMTGAWIPDRVAGQALADARLRGKMVTWFDWGEYAIWHLSPAVRVSIDGRRETIYSDAVLEAHDEMNAATPTGVRYLQQLDPEYVWLPAELAVLREWLAANGYRIDIRTARSYVAVRENLAALAVAGPPRTACFPGP